MENREYIPNRTAVLVRFKIGGDLRFLSHAETMRVFQRACVRAGVKLIHSQGYNPHPRMSLVLPRSVGVESDDEVLCLWLDNNRDGFAAESLKANLSKELPEEIEIVSVQKSESKKVPQASCVKYVMKVRGERVDEDVSERVEQLLRCKEILVERRISTESRRKRIDVRPYLRSISINGDDIMVEAKVSPAGTIRVDEILSVLGLGVEDLAGPVRRASIEWKCF